MPSSSRHPPSKDFDLTLAYFDKVSSKWVELKSIVDIEANTITAEVSHFTTFAILARLPPPSPPLPIPTPAVFECRSLSISPAEVDVNGEVTIEVVVTNTGGQSGNHTVKLRINDVVEATKGIRVSPGAAERVIFNTSKTTAGTYIVEINGLTGGFTVKENPVTPKFVHWLSIATAVGSAIVTGLLLYFAVVRSQKTKGK